MRRFFIVLVFLTSFLKGIYAQANSSLPFSCSGMVSFYEVSDDGWLTLNAPEYVSPAVVFLEQTNVVDVSQWAFSVRLDVNPSSDNMMYFFLQTNSDMSNGIFVSVGSAKDNIVLGTISNGKSSKLIATADKVLDANSSEADIVVRRSLICNGDSLRFELLTNVTGQMSSEGFCSIASSPLSGLNKMSVSTKYTKTRASGKFHIGNFSFVHDLPSVSPEPEPLPEPTPEPTPEPQPSPAPLTKPDSLSASFYRGCVIINELMPKPSDNAHLPNVEYIELYNSSDLDINLEGWTISTKTIKGKLPSFSLKSKSYIVLCIKSKKELFEGVCDVISPSAWPSLTNDECRLVLSNADGLVADYADYDIDIFGNTFKKDGGWSVERINANDLSGSVDSWSVSTDARGGTPGESNSVSDESFVADMPSIERVALDGTAMYITISFSQAIDTCRFPSYATISGVKSPFAISYLDSVTLRSFVLQLDEPLSPNTPYDFSLPFFSGLSSETNEVSRSFKIGTTSADVMGNVVINEIMSTSSVNADYIELYNKSGEILDLSEIFFCRMDDGEIKSLLPATTVSIPFFAGEYVVLTSSCEALIEMYNPSVPSMVIEVPSFPNIPQEGEVAIATKNGTIIDRVTFSDDMHNTLNTNLHDVALERIYTDVPSAEKSNWTSAASFYDYATPTQQNSQCRDGSHNFSSDDIRIVEKTISPDGDGSNDRLVIQCNFAEGEWIATLQIFDAMGYCLAMPYNNVPMPVSSELYWDGVADDGSRLSPGTYIVHLKAWQTAGEVKKYKKTCIIAYPRR